MSDVRNPMFARMYARISEREGPEQIEHRRELLAGLQRPGRRRRRGQRSQLRLYPPEVDKVTAVEPEPLLRSLAAQAALDRPCR